MYQLSSTFRMSCLRHRILVWTLIAVFSCSFVPSASFAQQPTATIKTLSGNVLVSGQSAIVGTVLQARDTIQTQARASAVLAFSDGSELHLAENTQVTIADLAQTATGARISSIKLLAGKLRALLSLGHQQQGSSFTIETPNALIDVKFSEPDIEVSYNPESVETIGIAYTVELMAKNLLTDEEVLVPVGSSVIIVGTTVKIVAGILAISGTTEAATTEVGATEATATETSSTGASGMGTGTKVAIGVGAAAVVGGVAVVMEISGGGNDGGSETAESAGDLSGTWLIANNSCSAQGCTEDLQCATGGWPSYCCGLRTCNECCQQGPGPDFQVTQTESMLSGIFVDDEYTGNQATLNGVVEGTSVSFTTEPNANSIPAPGSTNYNGVLKGNTIRGNFNGSGYAGTTGGETILITWTGAFTVIIEKE